MSPAHPLALVTAQLVREWPVQRRGPRGPGLSRSWREARRDRQTEPPSPNDDFAAAQLAARFARRP